MQIGQKKNSILEGNLFHILIVSLLVILYAPLILHWCHGWLYKSISIEHEYFSHGLLGLPCAAYIAWTNRKKWRRLKNKVHPLGGFLLLLGSVFYLSGLPELVDLSFPAILTGICLWLKGIPGFKLHGFPLLLVLLATPNSIPYLINPYILPLQKFISGFCGFILAQFGFDVTVNGIYLFIGGRIVEVAPHCAGLKMLFTCLYVALMLLYWTDNLKHRQKTKSLLVGTVIMSIAANITRNTVLSFFHGTGRDDLFHWLHDSWGGDIYSASLLAMVVLILNLVERFYADEEIVNKYQDS